MIGWNIIPILATLMMGGASAHPVTAPMGSDAVTAGPNLMMAGPMMMGGQMMMGPAMMGGDFNAMIEEMAEMHQAMENAGLGDEMEEHMEEMEKIMGFECPMHEYVENYLEEKA